MQRITPLTLKTESGSRRTRSPASDAAPAAKTATKPRPGRAKPGPKAETRPELRDLVTACLEDAKAEDIVTIALEPKTALADQMVIASGRSNRHVAALADQLVEKLKASGLRDLRIEGVPQCDWVLVDAGGVIIHLFRPEVRSFYNLEKLWSPEAPDERAATA